MVKVRRFLGNQLFRCPPLSGAPCPQWKLQRIFFLKLTLHQVAILDQATLHQAQYSQ